MSILKSMVLGVLGLIFMGVGMYSMPDPEGYSWVISLIFIALGYLFLYGHFKAWSDRNGQKGPGFK